MEYNNSTEAVIRNKEPKMDWAMFQLNALIKINDIRTSGDLENYYGSVNSLEIILEGWKDDEYHREIKLLEHRKELKQKENNQQQVNIYYYDEKMKLLSGLLYRINKGMERIRQSLEQCSLITEIATKNLEGIGQNLFITGKPGSGKSYSAMSIAQAITQKTGRKFHPEVHIAFTPQEFIKIYNNEKLTPPGSVIIFDEAGVSFNSKDHYKDGNKDFSKLMQTIRHRAIDVIMTAPDLGMVEKDGRKLLHYWLATERLEKTRGACYLKPAIVELSQRDGKILYPYPIYDGKKLTSIEIHKIGADIANKYERIAKEYKDDLALNTELSLGILKDNKVDRLKTFAKHRRNKLKIKEICDLMNINRNTGTSLEKQRKQLNL